MGGGLQQNNEEHLTGTMMKRTEESMVSLATNTWLSKEQELEKLV